MTDQTGLPRIVNNWTSEQNNNWPTLRGSKPIQTDSKWAENWNIGSMICIINILKVVSHDIFLGKRYSEANWATLHYLTLRQNCKFWHQLKMRLHRMIQNGKITSWITCICQMKGVKTLKHHLDLRLTTGYICIKGTYKALIL